MKIKGYVSVLMGLATIASSVVALPALAQTKAPGQGRGTGFPVSLGRPAGMMIHPDVFGTVSSVDGTTFTVTPRRGVGYVTLQVFTVDASHALVKKDKATSSVSNIAVGDTVLVQGTVDGTNVSATLVLDGIAISANSIVPGRSVNGGMMNRASSTLPVAGNGEPVIAGTIDAIHGASLAVSTKTGITYSVDVTSAKIFQGRDSISASDLALGDGVVIQGRVDGTSVVASSVTDQKAPGTDASGDSRSRMGFFGGIRSFFSHLFGF